jgi:TolA-binding protein
LVKVVDREGRRFELEVGRLEAHVAAENADDTVILTDDGTATARRAEFEISIGATCRSAQGTSILVRTGQLTWARGADRVELGAGQRWPECGDALALQNDAFEAAMNARRASASEAAIAAFEQFRRDFPESPLVQDATLELMRLFGSQKNPRSEEEAQRYLSTYPEGYARDEAQRLLRNE